MGHCGKTIGIYQFQIRDKRRKKLANHVIRLIYLGTPSCAVFPLQDLLALSASENIEVVAVVSREAQLIGRGKKKLVQDPPVAQFAKKHHIPVLQPRDAKDPAFLAQLRTFAPDIMITCAYGQILNEEFLAIPTRATINIHPSLLPQYRGATPVQTALLQGDKVSGVSILFTVKALDAGNLITQKIFPIADGETAGELQDRLFSSCKPLLVDALKKLRDPSFVGVEQDLALVTQCKRIKKEWGQVDWSQTSAAIINGYRAYQPWPGSFTFLQGKRVVLSQFRDASSVESFPLLETPGAFIFDKKSQLLVVKTGDGFVGVGTLQREGSAQVSAEQFFNGVKSACDPCFSMVKS
jgi:methionyl-tRNA formyltransferase